MNRRRPRGEGDGHEQLQLPAPLAAPKARRRIAPAPEQAAKPYIARRAKPSVVPGHVKLTFTFDFKRAPAERLSAQAAHEGKNLEAVIIELLDDACP
jgi:hypothetical protein